MRKALVLPPKKCLQCQSVFTRESCKQISDFREKKFCSRECYSKFNTKENHWYWRGGIKRRKDGYIRDSKTDKYIHRLIMEQHLGRELEKFEQVHHINHDPSDNRPENLILTENGEHRKLFHADAPRNKYGRFIKH